MTEQFRQVVKEVEQLPPETQNAIAALIRDELDAWLHRQRETLAALERLEDFRQKVHQTQHPAIDAVQLVREGRDELEDRLSL